MMTEAEAATKWCPQARYRREASNGDDAAAVNRGGDKRMADNKCIGSACMAWRWQDGASPAEFRGPSGYCGKAGRP